MLNIITSSVSDSLAIPLRRDRSCPEYKVVIPLGRDRLCRIRKAKKVHLRKAGEVVEKGVSERDLFLWAKDLLIGQRIHGRNRPCIFGSLLFRTGLLAQRANAIMITRSLLIFLLVLQFTNSAAQVHQQKKVQIAAGVALGGFKWKEVDGEGRAAGSSSGPMMTLPLTVHYGLAQQIDLGGYGELGILPQVFGDAIVLWNFGIEPRFFWLNRERIGASASFRFGASSMSKSGRHYTGVNSSAQLAAHWSFTERSGLQVQLSYLSSRMDGEESSTATIPSIVFKTEWVAARVLYVLRL